ncbi:MAG: glycosyltransferase family 4 protein [Actinomycetota bacterium]
MRILYLIDGLFGGGAEQSLAALAPCYADRGLALDVAYLREREGDQGELLAAGVGLFSLSGRGGRAGWVRRARGLVSSNQPDLIHTTLFESDVVGRIVSTLTRVPAVCSLVNVPYGPEHLGDPRLRAWKVRMAQGIDALTARRVVRFHAITSFVAEVMARRLRLNPATIDVVPRGRDPQRLGTRTRDRRLRARAAVAVDDGSPLVLVAARQEHQKGLDVLLKAFPLVLQALPGARLVVAGREGNQTPLLQDIVDRLGLSESVQFLGPRPDVPDLLCGADAFVLPSRWEGLGSVLVEAMALEAPIVASDLPAVREVLPADETARLVVPDRPDSLAAGILETLTQPGDAAERARRARARFLERYTIDRVADGMAAFYERALAPAGRAA